MNEELIIKKIKDSIFEEYKFSEDALDQNQKLLNYSKTVNDIALNIDIATINGVYGNYIRNGWIRLRFNIIDSILFGNRKSDFRFTISDHKHEFYFPNTIPDSLKLKEPIIYNTFSYWNDIRVFLPFLESSDIHFLNDLLVGKGENRKLIIWKLCNHPRYESFLKETTKSYEDYLKENPKDKSEARAFKEFKALVKRLEKVAPLYEWDEKYLEPKPFKSVMPIIP